MSEFDEFYYASLFMSLVAGAFLLVSESSLGLLGNVSDSLLFELNELLEFKTWVTSFAGISLTVSVGLGDNA